MRSVRRQFGRDRGTESTTTTGDERGTAVECTHDTQTYGEPMQMGFGLPISGSWATPPSIVEIAQAAERRGYASLWTFQRLLFPANDPIPMPYRSVHDPIVVTAYAAAVTQTARLGIAIANMPYYSPILLAKMYTSLDAVSGGRFDAGLGLGWNADEFAAVGTPMDRRGARAEEFIRCLRAIWADDPVEFKGEFYDVPPSYVDPKPVQRPHPPLLLGGGAESALRRIARLADGWIASSRFPAEQVPAAVQTLRSEATAAGRDPDVIRIVIRGSVKVRDTDEGAPPLTGTIEKIRRDIDAYAEAGATEFFVDLNFDDQIGNPDADPAQSMRRAHEALEAFAPNA